MAKFIKSPLHNTLTRAKMMAKPIRKTPTLTGKQAETFITKMFATQSRSINKQEKRIAELIQE